MRESTVAIEVEACLLPWETIAHAEVHFDLAAHFLREGDNEVVFEVIRQVLEVNAFLGGFWLDEGLLCLS